MAKRQRTVLIRQFITDMVSQHPDDIVRVVCDQFDISRQAASRHLREMCASGALKASGRTSGRRYELVPLAVIDLELPVKNLQEDVPWRDEIRPKLVGVKRNVLEICAYGFTEMLNNVIDHSESDVALIRCTYTPENIDFKIADKGVGIFRKIKHEMRLADEREAILELAKGKVTTDPAHHTGEGVFFTSRMFDVFSMWSGSLLFTHVRPGGDWLIETEQGNFDGTMVSMTVSLKSGLHPKDLFDRYTTSPDDLTFSKTHVPIRLAQYGEESLVSRSQARRVLARFERFDEVILDFSGVDFIGQAFADEIFRVYHNENPAIQLTAANAIPGVDAMIQRAVRNR